MGLDAVEIILRTEEVFAVDLPDSECAKVSTVGDLYRLLLQKLTLHTSRPEPSRTLTIQFLLAPIALSLSFLASSLGPRRTCGSR